LAQAKPLGRTSGAMTDTQWTLKVKIAALNEDAVDKTKKSKWKVGDAITIAIEPHATVNMLKQRIALIVMAHPKHQTISFGEAGALDEVTKLDSIEGLTNAGTLNVVVDVPPEPVEAAVVIEDDDGLFVGEEEELPALPAAEVLTKELSDEEMDKQNGLKQKAQDAIEDGDLKSAVTLLGEAFLLGGVTAMMLAKRAELLIKQKRYRATIADATLALSMNPDSAKAYKARGKARRFVGEYEGSAEDFSQAQKIDYDDSVADMHQWVQKRVELMKKKAKQEAKAAEAEAKAQAASG